MHDVCGWVTLKRKVEEGFSKLPLEKGNFSKITNPINFLSSLEKRMKNGKKKAHYPTGTTAMCKENSVM